MRGPFSSPCGKAAAGGALAVLLAALLGSKILEAIGNAQTGGARSQMPEQIDANAPASTREGVNVMLFSPSSGDSSPLTALFGHWQILALVLLLLAAALGAWWFFRRRNRRRQVLAPSIPQPQGRVLYVLVGTYGVRFFTLMALQMARTGAFPEVGMVIGLELDKKERGAFKTFITQFAPGLPVHLINANMPIGGTHRTFDEMMMIAARKEWGTPLKRVMGEAIDDAQRLGLRFGEVCVIDGLGSQPALGYTALKEHLAVEFKQARFYLQLIVPEDDPQRDRFESVLKRYRELAFIRAVLITDNSLGRSDNDKALCAWGASRFSPSLGGEGFNLPEDVSAPGPWAFLTIRRFVREVIVHAAAPPPVKGRKSVGLPIFTIKDDDLTSELKRLIDEDELFADSARALALEQEPPVAKRTRLLLFYIPADPAQFQRVVAEFKEILDDVHFKQEHAPVRVRFARCDVPPTRKAQVIALFLFGIPGGLKTVLKAIPAALSTPAPAPASQTGETPSSAAGTSAPAAERPATSNGTAEVPPRAEAHPASRRTPALTVRVKNRTSQAFSHPNVDPPALPKTEGG